MTSRWTLWLRASALVTLSACGGAHPNDARYPQRPDGCAVQVFQNTPPMATDNLGPVSARCDKSVSREDCLRELKDQACHLGGDVVWGVSDEPRDAFGKNEWGGRAVHTKVATTPGT